MEDHEKLEKYKLPQEGWGACSRCKKYEMLGDGKCMKCWDKSASKDKNGGKTTEWRAEKWNSPVERRGRPKKGYDETIK